ncbi:2-amino-4-hydroxy-6-hydroxymethyldihydropteridine diphosphokinase [Acetobacteraceae bacterium]|nr:2-amino-4-hydroxy-6-hydroxymethyldihydropteridine diphosphokinase [Acetobacteraceae bacterium]
MILSKPPLVQIRDLKIMAKHGILPHEKHQAQPFLISLDLSITPSEWLDATGEDRLSQTICYATLCEFSENFVQNHCFDLIETLSQKLADALLQTFKNLNHVHVTVKKPFAPINSPFENAQNHKNVQVTYDASKIYPIGIALGSNLGERENFLKAAIEGLDLLEGVEVLQTSSILETLPWGETNQGNFLNQCLLAKTTRDPFRLLKELKKLEREIGRVPSKKWGPRQIDLDLIFYADFHISHKSLNLPHPYAHERDFVLKPFLEINPNLKIGAKTVQEWLEALS